MSQSTVTLVWSIVVSIWAVGGMIGGVSASFCTDKFGRYVWWWCLFFYQIIMHQSVKLTGAIWLLQLVISSPLIHALVWPESSPYWDLNYGPQHERWTTYQLSYPSPMMMSLFLTKTTLTCHDFVGSKIAISVNSENLFYIYHY